MKLSFIILVTLILALFAVGQEISRRERLRSLISAARTGDLEARKALRNIRDKLRKRVNGTGLVEGVSDSAQQSMLLEPQPQLQEKQIPIANEPETEVIPSENSKLLTKSTINKILNDNHRALNRGLEVDTRSEASAVIRVTNETITPPVQTIKRYSYFDVEGNYIFGYEAADGSYKEEKRGLDCIVHGKYGYIDPDGVRREFTYISGNKCSLNTSVVSDDQVNQPLNQQFLIQKKVNRLHDTSIKSLQPNRRRRPIKIQQTQAKVQTMREKINAESTDKIEASAMQNNTLKIMPEHVSLQPSQSETPLSKNIDDHDPHISNAQIATKSSDVIFRPTSKPIDFNFDHEFRNVFSNFQIDKSHVRVEPKDIKALSPLPQIINPSLAIDEPAKDLSSVIFEDKQPTAGPHQLVFDSATGAFRTVPLLPTNFKNPPTENSPRVASFSSTLKGGIPLPLQEFNPLTTSSIGSLSFHESSIKNAAEFDNFFKQLHVN